MDSKNMSGIGGWGQGERISYHSIKYSKIAMLISKYNTEKRELA
jgi:hypothetical protein